MRPNRMKSCKRALIFVSQKTHMQIFRLNYTNKTISLQTSNNFLYYTIDQYVMFSDFLKKSFFFFNKIKYVIPLLKPLYNKCCRFNQ